MSRDANIGTFNEWVSAHKKHDIQKMLSCTTENVTITSAGFAPANGKQEAAAHWQGIYTAFSDMDINPATVTADEKRIVAEMDFGGTNTGKMGNMPPTGKKFKLRGAFVLDFNNDGKIEAFRTYYDPGRIMRQLGATK